MFTLKTTTKTPFTLVFSMVGYERQTIEVTNDSPINVSLKSGDELLQQVVVSASRIEENIQKAKKLIEESVHNNANIILLPELFENHYFCQEQFDHLFELANEVDNHPFIAQFQMILQFGFAFFLMS